MFKFLVHYRLNGKNHVMAVTGKNKWNALKRFQRKYPTIYRHGKDFWVTVA